MSAGDVTEPEEGFPVPEIDEAGIDRSQIRMFLELSPAERVGRLTAMLASIDRIRRGSERASS